MPHSGSTTGFEFSDELQVFSHTSQPTAARLWILLLQFACLGVSQHITRVLHSLCSGVITARINPNAAIACVLEENPMQSNSWLLLPPLQHPAVAAVAGTGPAAEAEEAAVAVGSVPHLGPLALARTLLP